jgi:hypothetical protein
MYGNLQYGLYYGISKRPAINTNLHGRVQYRWQSLAVGLTITSVPSARELLPLTVEMSASPFSQNFRQQFMRRSRGLDFACLPFSMDLFPSIRRDEKLQTDIELLARATGTQKSG